MRVELKDIHPEVVATINEVVVRDEGGWVLDKPDANDLDGGWTFGGVTKKLFNDFYLNNIPEHLRGREIARDSVEAAISTAYGLQQMTEDCIVIYHNEFVLPILRWTGDEECHVDQLSCAINLGMEVFKKLWTNLIKDDPHIEFCEKWKAYYVHLVVENAKAWRDCAIARKSLPDAVTPKSLRAIYLAGWLERVERYA